MSTEHGGGGSGGGKFISLSSWAGPGLVGHLSQRLESTKIPSMKNTIKGIISRRDDWKLPHKDSAFQFPELLIDHSVFYCMALVEGETICKALGLTNSWHSQVILLPLPSSTCTVLLTGSQCCSPGYRILLSSCH